MPKILRSVASQMTTKTSAEDKPKGKQQCSLRFMFRAA